MNPTPSTTATSTASPTAMTPDDHKQLGRLMLSDRLKLMTMVVASGLAGYIAMKLMGVPTVPGVSPLLLNDGVMSLAIAVGVSLIVGVLGLFAFGKVRCDAGIIAAASSLVPLRFMTGPMRIDYIDRPVSSTLYQAAIELAILALPLVVIHLLSVAMLKSGRARTDADGDGLENVSETNDQRLLATFCAFTTGAFLLMLMMHTDATRQAAISLLIASAVGSAIAFRFIPAVGGVWLWTSPILAGLIAYVWTAVAGTDNLPIGEPTGFFGALARAAPLDFACMGVLGSLYGYYFGRGWVGQAKTDAKAREA